MRRLHLPHLIGRFARPREASPAAATRLLLAALALPLAFVPAPLPAQTTQPPARPAKSLCFRGQRIDRCERFVLVQLDGLARIAGSEVTIPPPVQGALPYTERQLPAHISGEVGLMVNRDSTTALGATVGAGLLDDAGRLFLKARYRHWLGRNVSADLAAGPVWARVISSDDAGIRRDEQRIGATFDGAIGAADLIALIARVDVVPAPGGAVWAVYGGGRLGSHAAVAGGVVGLIIVGLAIAALATAYS